MAVRFDLSARVNLASGRGAGLLPESRIEQVIAVVRTLDSVDDVARSLAPLLAGSA